MKTKKLEYLETMVYGDLGNYGTFDGDYPDESDLHYQQDMFPISEEEEIPF